MSTTTSTVGSTAGGPTGDAAPLPVVSVGAGSMGRAWLQVLHDSPDVELVGLVDLDLDAAREAAGSLDLPDLPVGTDAVELAARTGARAVVDVTVPAAHHPVTTAALFAGLPVLGEKPAAATLAQTLSLAAASEITGELFVISQNRRWNPQLDALRQQVAGLGTVGSVSVEFFRAPHFGGFREEMDHPLLVDMAIHHLDGARYLLADEPVWVWCESFNPPWSWYAGDASATVVAGFARGTRLSYSGSWCAPGAETSWNGSWRVSAEHGSAHWDGDHDPVLSTTREPAPVTASGLDGLAGSLRLFCEGLRTGRPPMGEVHENALSLAMVDTALASARRGVAVQVDDVLEQAREQAVGEESRVEVAERLRDWGSVREALLGWAGPAQASM